MYLRDSSLVLSKKFIPDFPLLVLSYRQRGREKILPLIRTKYSKSRATSNHSESGNIVRHVFARPDNQLSCKEFQVFRVNICCIAYNKYGLSERYAKIMIVDLSSRFGYKSVI